MGQDRVVSQLQNGSVNIHEPLGQQALEGAAENYCYEVLFMFLIAVGGFLYD